MAEAERTVSDYPISLDKIETCGATRFGRGVTKMVVYYDDGRRVSLELPRIGELTPQQERILETLAESQSPMNRKNIALKVNKGNVTGRFGQSVSQLLSAGKIFERDGELTDDAKKFAATH